MGYRTYLGRISKDTHDKMQSMSLTYLVKKYGDGEYAGVYKLVDDELFCFGKYYEVDTKKYNHFFASDEMRKEYAEYDFLVVDKDFLLGIIEKERKEMADWYEECKTKTHDELIHQAERHASEWRGDFGCCPYNLDVDKPHLVDSWQRDYAIFDLVRIYKTFDWENDLLIYYGW